MRNQARRFVLLTFAFTAACDTETQRTLTDAAPAGGGYQDAGSDGVVADAFGDASYVVADAGGDVLAQADGSGDVVVLPACTVAQDATIKATLRVTADDYVRIWFNGALVAEPMTLWSVLKQYEVDVFLHAGQVNVIAVEARNEWEQNGYDRGFIAELAYTVGDETAFVNTDTTWKVSVPEVPNWTDRSFNDSAWAHPVSLGKSGIAPWGNVVFNTEAAWLWSYVPDQSAADKVEKETLLFRKTFFMNSAGRATGTPACQ